MTINRNRVISIFLIVLLLLTGTTTTSFADVKQDNNLSVIEIQRDVFYFNNGIDYAFMRYNYDMPENVLEISISGSSNISNGEYIIDFDKETLYSSYSNRTFSREFFTDGMQSQGVMPLGNSFSATYYINYAKLSEVVEDISNDLSIAVGIITVTALLIGTTLATGPNTVVTLIGSFLTIIIIGLNSRPTYSGITVTVTGTEQTKHQAGQTFTYYRYNITNIGHY